MAIAVAPSEHTVAIVRPVLGRLIAGQWVAVCPCGFAGVADADTTVMFCAECQNADILGLWRTVVMPDADQMTRIESVVRGREQKHRNWLPGETIAMLMIENLRHGIGFGGTG